MDSLPRDGELRTLAQILDLHPLLPLAWRAAQVAGSFLRDERPDDLVVQTKSTATDAVSQMDRGAEQLIVDVVLGTRPDDAFLGEEGGERTGTTGVRWIVDPLDGTVNYLYRLPMWGVSVAVEIDGVVVAGVVCAPDLDEDYVAVRGQGAWLVRRGRAERIHVREARELRMAMVVTGFNYSSDVRVRQAEVVHGLIDSVRDVRRLGAAVLDFAWLARGRLDAYYEKYLNPWDIAAGALIAQEAGAVVDGLTSEDLSEFVFVAVPGIAEELRAQLLRLGARDV